MLDDIFEIDACHKASQSCAWTKETKIVPGKSSSMSSHPSGYIWKNVIVEMDMEKYNKVTAIGSISGHKRVQYRQL